MRSASLLAFLAITATPALFAGPCMPDLLSNYILLGAAGCQNGSFNVNSFSFMSLPGTNFTILASDITVTPNSSSNSYGLNFTSPKFNLTGTEVAKYLLSYTDPGDLRSLEDIMNATTPVFPGFATVTTDTCPGAAFGPGGTCINPIQTIVVTDNGVSSTLMASTDYSPSVSILGIRDTIDLEAKGALSQIAGFQGVAFVPEPSTLVAGLLALAAVTCRRLHRH
jgi:hypothetical protein